MTKTSIIFRILIVILCTLGLIFKIKDFYIYGWHSPEISNFLILFTYISTILTLLFNLSRFIFIWPQNKFKNFIYSTELSALLTGWSIPLIFVCFANTLPLAIDGYNIYNFLPQGVKTPAWFAEIIIADVFIHLLTPIFSILAFTIEKFHKKINPWLLFAAQGFGTLYVCAVVIYEAVTKRQAYFFLDLTLLHNGVRNVVFWVFGFIIFGLVFSVAFSITLVLNNYIYPRWRFWIKYQSKKNIYLKREAKYWVQFEAKNQWFIKNGPKRFKH